MRNAGRILPLAAACLLAGCGYHMGTDAAPPFSSLTIEPIRNESYAPQLQAEMHRQLADSLAQEKALHVTTEGGSARLRVTLTDFRRDVGAVNPNDTVLAASYNLTLVAKVTLETADRVYFKDRIFSVSLPAFGGAGYNRTETQTLPLLSRELSKRIKDAVVDVWYGLAALIAPAGRSRRAPSGRSPPSCGRCPKLCPSRSE